MRGKLKLKLPSLEKGRDTTTTHREVVGEEEDKPVLNGKRTRLEEKLCSWRCLEAELRTWHYLS